MVTITIIMISMVMIIIIIMMILIMIIIMIMITIIMMMMEEAGKHVAGGRQVTAAATLTDKGETSQCQKLKKGENCLKSAKNLKRVKKV